MPLSGLSIDSNGGEGSVGVISHTYSVLAMGFAIVHEKVNGAVACVQDFMRHLPFTQRNYSETGISMLSTVVAAQLLFDTAASLTLGDQLEWRWSL